MSKRSSANKSGADDIDAALAADAAAEREKELKKAAAAAKSSSSPSSPKSQKSNSSSSASSAGTEEVVKVLDGTYEGSFSICWPCRKNSLSPQAFADRFLNLMSTSRPSFFHPTVRSFACLQPQGLGCSPL